MSQEQYKARVFTDLGNGRPVAPGETFTLPEYDKDDQVKAEHDKRLIKDRKIISVPKETQTSEGPSRKDLEARAKELKVEGISGKNMEELQQAIVEAEEKQKGGGS